MIVPIILFAIISVIDSTKLSDCKFLFQHANEDSICNFIESTKEYIDSTIQINKINIPEDRFPLRRPDITVTLTERQKISILLLDSNKNFLNVSFIGTLEAGTYDFYHNALSKYYTRRGMNEFLVLAITREGPINGFVWWGKHD